MFFPSISPKQLQKLYASIRSEPFKIPEDDGNDLTLTFFNPDREGWLLKMGETTIQKQNKETNKKKQEVLFLHIFTQYKVWLSGFFEGGRVKTWKRRWFILTDSCLYYFEYTTVSSKLTF